MAIKFIVGAKDLQVFAEYDNIEEITESEIEKACRELDWDAVEEEVRGIVYNAVLEIRNERD
jgi:hypothetical protein